jgi:hypothetical protein
MEIELKRFQHELTEQYGQASHSQWTFFRSFPRIWRRSWRSGGLTTEDLGNNPGILETLVGNQYERCLFSPAKGKSQRSLLHTGCYRQSGP